MMSFIWLGLLASFVGASVTSVSAAVHQQPNYSRVIIQAEAPLADKLSCQKLDKAVVERARIVAKMDPKDGETGLALNRAYHRITAARIDCKHGRVERAHTRYAQALDDLSGLPPTLAKATKDDDGSP